MTPIAAEQGTKPRAKLQGQDAGAGLLLCTEKPRASISVSFSVNRAKFTHFDDLPQNPHRAGPQPPSPSPGAGDRGLSAPCSPPGSHFVPFLPSDAFKGAFIAQSRCLQFIMVFQLWAGKVPGIEPVSVIYGQCIPNPIDTSHKES